MCNLVIYSKRCFMIVIFCLICFNPAMLLSNSNERITLVLNNPINSGFGAIFSSVLSALNVYEQGGYGGIKIDLNSGIYLDPERGPNYWEYFFKPINLGNESNIPYAFTSDDVSMLINAGFVMPRERGFELIQKYIHLKPHIEQEVDAFVQSQFNGYFTIAIHHRGTDKKVEVPIVPYQTIICHVLWWLANGPKDKIARIFIATDDQNFLNYMCQLFPGQVIYNDFVRSQDGNPLHYGNNWYLNNYQKGKEALVDCLLLGKCDVLLFPAASAFSMATLKFNPQQIAIPLSGF